MSNKLNMATHNKMMLRALCKCVYACVLIHGNESEHRTVNICIP